jgi:hypothetical protein
MALNERILNKMGQLNNMVIMEKDKTKIEEMKKVIKSAIKDLLRVEGGNMRKEYIAKEETK